MISPHTKEILYVGPTTIFTKLQAELFMAFSDVGGATLVSQDFLRHKNQQGQSPHIDALLIDVDHSMNLGVTIETIERTKRKFPRLPILGLSQAFDSAYDCPQSETIAVNLYQAGLDYGHTLSPESGLRVLAEKFRRIAATLPCPEMAQQAQMIGSNKENIEALSFGELIIDPARHLISYKNKSKNPAQKTFACLLYLASSPDVVRTRNNIMDAVHGNDVYVDERTIDSHIKKLRKDLRSIGCPEDLILTTYGRGYAFKPQVLGVKPQMKGPLHRREEIGLITKGLN